MPADNVVLAKRFLRPLVIGAVVDDDFYLIGVLDDLEVFLAVAVGVI